MSKLKLEVRYVDSGWTGSRVNHWKIVDAGQPDEPEVCRVYKLPGDIDSDTEHRAKALAELIELGWRVRYGSNEEEL